MQSVQAIGEDGIVRGQKNQAICLRAEGFGQGMATLGIARAQNHHTALGQAASGGDRISEPIIVCH